MSSARLPAYLLALGVLLTTVVVLEVGLVLISPIALEPLYLIFLAAMIPFIAVMCGGGICLRRENFPERRFRRIGGWTLGGILFWGGLFLVVGIVAMPPEQLFGAVRWGIAVGGGSGFVIGVFEARGIESERRAERRRIRERELEERTERLDEFARIISHDLRNPLAVATGQLSLARRDHDDERLETVRTALDRVEEILTDTLELARHGQVITEPESIDLDAIARTAWRNVETREASLDVTSSTTFEADPERLEQVFENLFRNAIDHGGRDVTITVGALPTGNGFFIEDDGRGIPDDRRDVIFDPGESEKSNGTGFGLTIVRSIVAAHDWDIEAVDGREGGARFEVEWSGTPIENERRIAA